MDYFFDVSTSLDISGGTALLNARLSSDPIFSSMLVSTSIDGSNILTISLNVAPVFEYYLILDNMVQNAYFAQVPGIDIMKVQVNENHRDIIGLLIAPTVNNDVNQCFTPGSEWIMSTGDIYKCTSGASGAAVWTPMTWYDWKYR